MRILLLTAVALFASQAVAQIAIPPHANVYNGFSRGFQFTAQTSFFIIGLDLPTDARQAGDTASYLVRINGTTALRSIGNPGPIAVGLAIATGDSVDIIGNWSPAAAGSFTARNSYGSNVAGAGAAPYATLIEGVPHTLNRNGWQWDIGDPAWVSNGPTGAYLAPTTGQMGRILVTTAASGSGTVATNTTLGAGCVASYASFYENFAASTAFDLATSALTMLPSGAGYVTLSGVTAFVPPSATATSLALTDDSQTTVTLSTPFSYPGGTTTTLSVCSNGYVSVSAAGNGTSFAPVVATFLGAPNTGWWSWHDYNPAAAGSGQVKFEQVGGIAYITWDGVYSFNTTTPDTFQMQFDTTNGSVHLVWGAMGLGGTTGYLVGYSPGGVSADPGNRDLSATLPGTFSLVAADILPLQLTATTRPITGTSWNLTTSNIPATGLIGVNVLGVADPGINDLFFLGAPGCGLRATIDVTSGWTVAGPTQPYSLPIPNNPALVNVNLYSTSAVFQVPPINAFGAITSNGIQGKIGSI